MVLLMYGALRESRPADTDRALPKEEFDKCSKPHRSVNKKCACVAFGVYAVSCWLPPFVLTFPPRGQFPRSDLVPLVPSLLWLANPIIVLGMFMLGAGARRGAAIARTVAIVFLLADLVKGRDRTAMSAPFLRGVQQHQVIDISQASSAHPCGYPLIRRCS
jgi:hypothetical protein